MRLRKVTFIGQMPVIHDGKATGENMFADLRESNLDSAEGWDIEEVEPGRLVLRAPWLSPPGYRLLEGVCYSATPFAEVAPVDVEAPIAREQLAAVVPTKGKKR